MNFLNIVLGTERKINVHRTKAFFYSLVRKTGAYIRNGVAVFSTGKQRRGEIEMTTYEPRLQEIYSKLLTQQMSCG